MSENVKIAFNFLFHKFSSALAWETGYFLCFSTFPNLGIKEDLPRCSSKILPIYLNKYAKFH